MVLSLQPFARGLPVNAVSSAMTEESVPSSAVARSYSSSHFHARPSHAGIQPEIPFGTVSSLHLDPPRSSLRCLLLMTFPLNGLWH